MGVVDIIQTDIDPVGGITALWKVAMAAAASGITMAPHGCEGPIGLLASCHLDSAIPNFLIQECCGNIVPQPRDKVWLEWFGFPAMRMVNGKYPLTEKPGLGIRSYGGGSGQVPIRRHEANGQGLPAGRVPGRVVSRREAPIYRISLGIAPCRNGPLRERSPAALPTPSAGPLSSQS